MAAWAPAARSYLKQDCAPGAPAIGDVLIVGIDARKGPALGEQLASAAFTEPLAVVTCLGPKSRHPGN